jgi:ribonucleoside-diphosphate reductase alpha chain
VLQFEKKSPSLPTQYQEFIHLSRYARWMEDEGRRESSWSETVSRWGGFWRRHLAEKFSDRLSAAAAGELVDRLEAAVLGTAVLPSMRTLMTAGPALERDHAAGYNCWYVAIDDQAAFAEVLYLLACGGGVGFSVERQYIKQLPLVAESMHEVATVITVEDSKIGWAVALRQLIAMLYVGQVPGWDVSGLRPAGARLKTFGGRASGPEPLVRLFKFAVALFKEVSRSYAAGERDAPRLTSLECHDLLCVVGDAIVSGGVRRSALISLSNVSDDRMRNAKNGGWRERAKWRELANNSAAYTERPGFEIFLKEMVTLYESYSGERGIFSRVAAQRKAAENGRRRATYLRDGEHRAYEYGTNPCGEIILRSCQPCNLSTTVIRAGDSFEDVREKVELATIIGTLQSTLTDFRFLRRKWRENAEEERLLGVSMTGIFDHPVLGDPELAPCWLRRLREHAVDVNSQVAEVLGIPASAAITTVKPEGTSSQMVDASSGMHPRHAPFYIRRVINDDRDPVTALLKEAGVPHEPVAGKEGVSTVFEFPMRAPAGAATRADVPALRQLEMYAVYREHWCEHNPSTTIYYRPGDFFSVSQWVWDNFDRVGGIALLPSDDHAYAQAPFEDIDEAEYLRRAAAMPPLDWSRLRELETEDGTNPQGTAACAGGACEANI